MPIPTEYICSISTQIMTDPALTNCKHIFDRSSLIDLYMECNMNEKKHSKPYCCPQCKTTLEPKKFTDLPELKNEIAAYVASNPTAKLEDQIDWNKIKQDAQLRTELIARQQTNVITFAFAESKANNRSFWSCFGFRSLGSCRI